MQHTPGMQADLRKKMVASGFADFFIEYVCELIRVLSQNGVQGIDRYATKLKERAGNNEDFQDVLTEGRFALILAANRFSNVHLEPQPKGPDIQATFDDRNVYFEVTRRRPNEEDEAVRIASEKGEACWVSTDTEVCVSPAGDIQARVISKALVLKIKDKLRQAKPGDIYVVVLWSDSVRTGVRDAKVLFRYIEEEIAGNPEHYNMLSGILFTEFGAIDMATGTQFDLFKNQHAAAPIDRALERKLKTLRDPQSAESAESLRKLLRKLRETPQP